MLFDELASFLERAAAPAVLLLDDADGAFSDRARRQWEGAGRSGGDVSLVPLSAVRAGDGGRGAATVVLLVEDPRALRRAIFGLRSL